MIKLKKYIRIGGLIALLVYAGGAVFVFFEKSENKSRNINLECFGVIEDFKIEENHATPSFFINSSWTYLGLFGHDIKNKVQVGDSVAKKSGEDVLLLYRKRGRGYNLIEKVEL